MADAPDDCTGIVITDLEGSDDEDEGTDAPPPAFEINPALLDRLPHPLAPATEPGASAGAGALVLYRPLVVAPEADSRGTPGHTADVADADAAEASRAADGRARGQEPIGREVGLGVVDEDEGMAMEDTRPSTPMAFELGQRAGVGAGVDVGCMGVSMGLAMGMGMGMSMGIGPGGGGGVEVAESVDEPMDIEML